MSSFALSFYIFYKRNVLEKAEDINEHENDTDTIDSSCEVLYLLNKYRIK